MIHDRIVVGDLPPSALLTEDLLPAQALTRVLLAAMRGRNVQLP
jgi:hypothetical protein